MKYNLKLLLGVLIILAGLLGYACSEGSKQTDNQSYEEEDEGEGEEGEMEEVEVEEEEVTMMEKGAEMAREEMPDQDAETDISPNTEITENPFVLAKQQSTSTFSIDVDHASYSSARSYIQNGGLPPPSYIRTEEFINYFDYSYPQPKGNKPFSITTEVGKCPWNTQHRLLHIGIQGKKVNTSKLPPANLVFLIDVSGSMDDANKLPLLKKSFRLLVSKLREQDKVAIVVYAGSAGLVLPPTSNKQKIIKALDKLQAGGSTAGGQGIRLAYKVAQKNLRKDGNNRVIIATDGDFNVGESSDEALVKLIEQQRNKGIYLTALGLGMGYNDRMMEKVSNAGNGNYYYIDNDNEARKVFGTGLSGTLLTIAKDVKIQVQFNSQYVKSYRLIGYENRVLANEDFEDDTKDAGEIGAGHTVTALYELVLVNPSASNLGELRLRYKKPKANNSLLITKSIQNGNSQSLNFRFSAAVAAFSLLLKDSKYKGKASYAKVVKWATAAKGKDKYGYRKEFIQLVRDAEALSRS